MESLLLTQIYITHVMDGPGFKSLQGWDIFFSPKPSRKALRSTQPQMGAGFSGDKVAEAWIWTLTSI